MHDQKIIKFQPSDQLIMIWGGKTRTDIALILFPEKEKVLGASIPKHFHIII